MVPMKNYATTQGVKLKTENGLHDLTVQIGSLWDITGSYLSNEPFAIKNLGEEPVDLEVKLVGMDDFITTTFYQGWNIELVVEVRNVPAEARIQGGNL